MKEDSIPEKALLLARSYDVICLSGAVINEIQEVLSRPKFKSHISDTRRTGVVEILRAAAHMIQPTGRVTECREHKDNIYLESPAGSRAVAAAI